MQFIPYSLYPMAVRPLLFSLDAERAHDITISAAKFLSREPFKTIFAQKVDFCPVSMMGLTFKNPVGLAAGLDKNGEAIDFFGALGFGHIEVGTVTPLAQEGNVKPRMFRIAEASGIINRMGFNNKGVDYLVENLKKRTYDGILGVSIGKNEITPLDDASKDYLICMDKVYPYADYIAVNVSCPNTPDLTKLQAQEPLRKLLKPLKDEQKKLSEQNGRYVPLVVKLSSDLDDNALENLCKVCLDLGIDGLTCTNTTTSRDMVHGMSHAQEWGGLSGQPLRQRSNLTLAKVKRLVGDRIPIIGVGGVCDTISAREKLTAGASLVQVYSSLIYNGPYVVKDIVKNI